jgi:hypothetical protein
MKNVLLTIIVSLVLVSCGMFLSEHSEQPKNAVKSQGCIGWPTECLGGE